MELHFSKVSSCEAFDSLVSFLIKDVLKHGGTATEIVDMHGHIMQLTVCAVPWGTLLIEKEVTRFEAWCFFQQDIE